MTVDDRYSRSDFGGRQDRYHDFDQRDRSRYQDDVDRREHRDRDGQVNNPSGAMRYIMQVIIIAVILMRH